MSKSDMLELLSEQETEINRLKAKEEEASKAIDERAIVNFTPESAGSLAEASIKISGVINAAEDAAEIYLKNVKKLEDERRAHFDRLESQTHERASQIFEDAERRKAIAESEAKKIITNAKSILDYFETQVYEMRKRYTVLEALIDDTALRYAEAKDSITGYMYDEEFK